MFCNNDKIKEEKSDRFEVFEDCATKQKIKQEPLYQQHMKTHVNLYDSQFDSIKHELLQNGKGRLEIRRHKPSSRGCRTRRLSECKGERAAAINPSVQRGEQILPLGEAFSPALDSCKQLISGSEIIPFNYNHADTNSHVNTENHLDLFKHELDSSSEKDVKHDFNSSLEKDDKLELNSSSGKDISHYYTPSHWRFDFSKSKFGSFKIESLSNYVGTTTKSDFSSVPASSGINLSPPTSDHFNSESNKRIPKMKNVYLCKYCPFKFTRQVCFLKHMKTHLGNVFLCDICNHAYMTKRNLVKHMWKHILVEPHCCKICGYGFRRRQELIGAEMAQNYDIKCICKCKQYLAQHKLKQKKDKPFSWCLYNHKYARWGLIQHKSICSNKRPPSCQHCDHKCNSKNDLNNHTNIHHSGKSHQYKNCDYKCSGLFLMKQHKFIHPGEKLITCKLCNYVSGCKEYMDSQISKQTSDVKSPSSNTTPVTADWCSKKQYTCDLCYEKFSLNIDLFIHMRAHVDTKWVRHSYLNKISLI